MMWPFSKKPAPIQWGIVGGLAQVAYIALVVWLMNALASSFMSSGRAGQADQLMPFFILLLFVVSAAISALIMFGYPITLIVQKNLRAGLIAAGAALVTLIVCGVLFWLVYAL